MRYQQRVVKRVNGREGIHKENIERGVVKRVNGREGIHKENI
jgi:hypothetical protein